MEYQPKEINKKGIYVLKKEGESRPITDFIYYDQSLSEITGYDEILKILENETNTLEEKIKEVSQFVRFLQKKHSYLLPYRNFCGNNALVSSFIRNPNVDESTNFTITKWESLDYHHIRFDSDINRSCILENWIYDIFHGYYYEQAFKIIENNNDIKFYSHRRYGYYQQKFSLSDDFTIRILTNFGYGSASYLNSAIEYKNVLLINYSDYVRYRYIGSKYMTTYSKAYYPNSENWEKAFDFIKEICDDYLENNLQKFIKKIEEECEKLVATLALFLRKNNFIFYKNPAHPEMRTDSKAFTFHGIELTQFRGEKISGALDFIESLENLNKIIPTKEYIRCIENYAIEVLIEIKTALVHFYKSYSKTEIEDDYKLNTIEEKVKSHIEVINAYFKHD